MAWEKDLNDKLTLIETLLNKPETLSPEDKKIKDTDTPLIKKLKEGLQPEPEKPVEKPKEETPETPTPRTIPISEPIKPVYLTAKTGGKYSLKHYFNLF